MLISYSSGIGLQVVRQLAQHGAKVYATTRSQKSATKAQNALSNFNNIAPHAVEWLQMDLTDLRSITEVAEEVKRRTSSLHILGRTPAFRLQATLTY